MDLEKKNLASSTNQNNLNKPPVAHLIKEGHSPKMGFTQFFNDKKSAKKNTGRILKLQSDIFALIGRLDLAIKK